MNTATATRPESTPEHKAGVIRNGVNLDQLVGTIEAIKANPALAQFQFRTKTCWDGCGRSVTRIQGFSGAGQEDTSRSRPFEVASDEPPVLLGGNSAPNAVELVLTALASCLSVGYAYNAAAQGIPIEALEFDLEGDIDLHGFLGLSDQVRPGFRDIRLTYRVRSDAPREKLQALCDYVQRTSPVLDIIRNAVPVAVELAG
ncbi:MAG: OsmC family protein [Ideonella sp.]|nr:OsmC family protein [Ideonella sp.]MCC7455395.1 OsmC family protein [Nitrospira sp.]